MNTATLTIPEFVQRLRELDLLGPREWADVEARCEEPHEDGVAFVRTLVTAGVLTNYQAKQVWNDRGSRLVMGGYVVEDEIGRGGMGVVLRARHRRMKRLVAIKVMSASITRDERANARFQREVEALARLSHPNIVTAHDAGEVDGRDYLVMEYVEGRDLEGYVREHGPLDVDGAVACIQQAAEGLAYAHSRNIVHRDVKPANLLLGNDGVVKILDLGLARLDEGFGSQGALTSSDAIMGTVDYMAPEQARSTRIADARSDIYSLGISLYRLLTNRIAYPGDSAMVRLLAHTEQPIPDMREHATHVPEGLQRVFEQMVAKQPEDRQQSMEEVLEDLAAMAPVAAGTRVTAPARRAKDVLVIDFDDADVEIDDSPEPRSPRPTESVGPRTAGRGTKSGKSGKSQRRTSADTTTAGAGSETKVTKRRRRRAPNAEPVEETTLPLYRDPRAYFFVVFCAIGATIVLSIVDGDTWRSLARAVWPGSRPYEGTRAGQSAEFTGETAIAFQWCPPGSFAMGSPDSETGRDPDEDLTTVRLTRGFWISRTEITQKQYADVMGERPWNSTPGATKFKAGDDYPAVYVSWEDATSFCRRLNTRERGAGRLGEEWEYALPTEAQWEYACRAGTNTPYSFGDDSDDLADHAWYEVNAQETDTDDFAHRVGLKTPNPWGLFDVHGNVEEWCRDNYTSTLPGGTDPLNEERNDPKRVCRGGGWWDDTADTRSAYRGLEDDTDRDNDLGFRIVLQRKPKPTADTADGKSSAAASGGP